MHQIPTSGAIDMLALTPKEQKKILVQFGISLTGKEAVYFQKKMGRPLRLTELMVLGIQGSEHCSYRSTRQHLSKLPTKGKWVVLGPGQDAGAIEMARDSKGKKWVLVVGHESHNHPSQIVPFEGAATGVGGLVRDIACMGATVVGTLDCLRFGSPKKALQRNIFRQVVRGIAGYGNPLGVANLGGDIAFEEGFNDNCLVNVVAVGAAREDHIIPSFVPKHAAKEHWDIILVGKPTDRSGFGGAAFASDDLVEEDAEKNRGAVQEPNPFLERHVLAATYGLFNELIQSKKLSQISFKDLGAGGVVCAAVEQVEAAGLGACIDIHALHRVEGIPAAVAAVSETQERFCFMCHPKLTKKIIHWYRKKWQLPAVSEGANATVIGKVTEGNFVVKEKKHTLIDAKASVLTEGLRYNRPYATLRAVEKKAAPIQLSSKKLMQLLPAFMARPNVADRKEIYTQYDSTVGGRTVQGPGKGATVIQPFLFTGAEKSVADISVAVGVGGCSRLGSLCPHTQAAMAVYEAVGHAVALGGAVRGLTDCLNYTTPETKHGMGQCVAGIAGLTEAASGLGLAFVSGNVSLYNAVPASAVVAAFGIVPEQTEEKAPKGACIMLLSVGDAFFGGSEIAMHLQKKRTDIKKPSAKKMAAFFKAAVSMRNTKGVTHARYVRTGGVLKRALEYAHQEEKGLALQKQKNAALLMAETPGFMLVVEESAIKSLKKKKLEKGIQLKKIGMLTEEQTLAIGAEKAPMKKIMQGHARTIGRLLTDQ